MIREFEFAFEELGLQKSDIEEVLGSGNIDIPEPFVDIVDKALELAPSKCNIRGGFRIFDSDECRIDKNVLKIGNFTFTPSKIVLNHFKNASSFALFISTAGAEISKYAGLIANEDPMLGYVLDIVGSVTVEKATEKIQEELETLVKSNGLSISDRFSPGYCGWSVSEQQLLFALLPSGFCGITLSESSLMSPIKSVSGITGIGNNLVQKGYQCLWCNDKNCHYGNIKRMKKRKKKQ